MLFLVFGPFSGFSIEAGRLMMTTFDIVNIFIAYYL